MHTSANEGPGQCSVPGQHTDANYFMVDGVSANFGVQISALGQALGGAIPAFTSQGGTNGFVSADAMQEFRIQTSSYEPDSGRTPDAQFYNPHEIRHQSVHGTVFDYLRSEIFDARSYFDAPSASPTASTSMCEQSTSTSSTIPCSEHQGPTNPADHFSLLAK